MPLDKFRSQVRHRVAVKIRGKIAEPDPLPGGMCRPDPGQGFLGEFYLGKSCRAMLQLGRRSGKRQERKGRGDQLPRVDLRHQSLHPAVKIIPLADKHLAIQGITHGVGDVRLQGKGALVAGESFIPPLQILQQAAAIVMSIGVTGGDGKGAIVGGESFLPPAQQTQGLPLAAVSPAWSGTSAMTRS